MKAKMKKLLSVLLAMVMLFSLSMPALATEGEESGVIVCTKNADCTLTEGHDEGCPKAVPAAPQCTKSDECTLTEGHEEGCPKAVSAVPQCTQNDECTLTEGHEEGCPKAVPAVPQCTQSDDCTLTEGHEEGCPKAAPVAPVCGGMEGCGDGQHNEECAMHDAASCINCNAVDDTVNSINARIEALPEVSELEGKSLDELKVIQEEILAISQMIDALPEGVTVDETKIEAVANVVNAQIMTLENENENEIDLADDSYTIETAGDYVVSAYTGEHTLTIKADATVKLQGVNITAGADTSAISIESGNVTLNVTADSTLTGGDNGAGIYVAEGASVTVTGTGTLTAIGNAGKDDVESGAAGIGGTSANGNSGAITIDGATVIAKGYGVHGSGIGSGSGKVVGEIKIINNANVTAYGGYYANGEGTKLQSDYGKTDPEGGAAIGGGGKTVSTIANITITDSTVKAYGGSKAAGIGANFWSSCGTITISGNSDVTAQGGSSSAGIGTSRAGDNGVSANIVISGGTVAATGGAYGAGIGAGYNNDSLGNRAEASALPETSITISGGNVTATGGEGGAGIGGGYKSDNVNIDITGGNVTASAGALVSGKTIETGGEACAIGSGANGSGKFENSPPVEISGGTVNATTEFGGKPAIEGWTDDAADVKENVTVTVKNLPPVKISREDGDVFFDSLADAVKEAEQNDTITVLKEHEISEPIVIEKALTLNLNGCAITGVNAVYPVIRVQGGANVTVKNGTINNKDYVFVLGASDGSSAGDLTIESGTYHGDTTVASVTKGTLTINGGEFSVVPYNDSYAYLLNCIDANYKDKSANIVVKGGTFHNWNPADNAAEGEATNFVAEKYKATETNGVWTVAFDESLYVAEVENERFESFAKAVEAANEVEGGATVTLLKDVTLGEKLTVTGDVTISGAYTITRDDVYTGTLFAVPAGGTLTLDGGLTIDGGNAWTYKQEKPALKPGGDTYMSEHVTPVEGAPNAAAYMIENFGELNVNNVTIQNQYSTNEAGVIKGRTGSVTTLNGATIKHIASNNCGAIVQIGRNNVTSTDATLNIRGNTRITDNMGAYNGGIIIMHSQGNTFNFEGGSIDNNYIVAAGTVIMSWCSTSNNKNTVNMSDGIITQNEAEGYGPMYIHTNSVWNMSGGEISNNISYYPNYVRSNNSGSITGGKIVHNQLSSDYVYPDIAIASGSAPNLPITGGTFTQDISQWLAPDTGLVYNENTGIYGVTEELYEYNGIKYNTLADAVTTAANDAAPVVKVLASHKVDDAMVISKDLTLDLNGCTITGAQKDGVQVYPVIRVQGGANVTVKNGTINNEDYVFVLGASDGSSAGNLTIESGTYHGDTTVASVTKGTLTINGGEFSVDPYEGSYAYLLNCIDANYKDKSANIVVKGGTFHNWNPADNAAEGAGTNFVATGYRAEETAENSDIWTVQENLITVTIENKEMADGGIMPEFTYTVSPEELSEENVAVTFDKVTVNGTGDYTITATANVTAEGWDDYKVVVQPGTLTVKQAVVEMDGVNYTSIKDALWTLKSADTTTHTVKVLVDHEIDVNYSTYNYPILINGFSVILDLNGKTITADWSKYTGSRADNALIGVCNGGKLTVIDSDGKGKIVNNDTKDDVENRIFWIMTGTATKELIVNIEGGTFVQNDINTALLYIQGNRKDSTDQPVTVNIKGGTFESVNEDFFNAYDGFQYTALITGGTFNHDPSDHEIKIAEDYHAKNNGNGVWSVEEKPTLIITIDSFEVDADEELPDYTYTTNMEELGVEITDLVVTIAPDREIDGVGTYTLSAEESGVSFAEKEHYKLSIVSGTLTIKDPVYVAQVGENKYKTLEAAAEAANLTDGTIELLNDVTDDATITGDVTLETNGFAVKGTVTVNENGSLTVGDVVIGGPATVTQDKITAGEGATVTNGGTDVTLPAGGYITVKEDQSVVIDPLTKDGADKATVEGIGTVHLPAMGTVTVKADGSVVIDPANVYVDTNNNGKYDKDDVNYDRDGNGKPDLNVDKDGDYKVDATDDNVDTDGDGKPNYKIIKGAKGVWYYGNTWGLSFTANGLYEDAKYGFQYVEVDDVKLASTNYTAKSGSTVITLDYDYLQGLSAGEHKLTVVYPDGEASTTFYVREAAIIPATGDNSQIGLWIVVFGGSVLALGIAAAVIIKRRKNEEA